MNKLLFASNNRHKADEIRAILGDAFEIITLREAGIEIAIPEPHDTLHENAREKSTVIFSMTGLDCFSEDSGLEVAVLHGEPGVRSARYAGEHAGDSDNIEKLLSVMNGCNERSARFRTVISLVWKGKEVVFEGECVGSIQHARSGSNGFGYDPVFVPEGEKRSFGEMTMEEKKLWSHRRKAIEKMVAFLRTQTESETA